MFNYSINTVINYNKATFLEFLGLWELCGASRKNLNCLNAVAVVQTTVQTVQPERIMYLLEQLLGGGVKEP